MPNYDVSYRRVNPYDKHSPKFPVYELLTYNPNIKGMGRMSVRLVGTGELLGENINVISTFRTSMFEFRLLNKYKSISNDKNSTFILLVEPKDIELYMYDPLSMLNAEWGIPFPPKDVLEKLFENYRYCVQEKVASRAKGSGYLEKQETYRNCVQYLTKQYGEEWHRQNVS